MSNQSSTNSILSSKPKTNQYKFNQRPSTAPSSTTSKINQSHQTTSSHHHLHHHTTPIHISPIPSFPPIPSILSHAPTRSHLFKHLIKTLNHSCLSHLILLLDLLSILRAHLYQTNWSFDDPDSPSSISQFNSTPPQSIIHPSKSRIRSRPGTSDGISPTSSRLRQHTRSHLFRSILPPPHHSLQPTSINPILDNHHPSLQPTPRSHQPPWFIHLLELYSPPLVDLHHGWFVPLPLPSHSPTLQSLQKLLSTNPTPTPFIDSGPNSLKQIGQVGCQELSQLVSVCDWWSQHSSHLWPECTRQQKCQTFNDLLSLWPSLHFPTPSLSQLYKLSNNLSKSRTRSRLTESPSENALRSTQSFHSRATLRGLFEIYVDHPSSTDLELIESFILSSKSTSTHWDVNVSFPVPPQTSISPSSRSPVLRLDPNKPQTSPLNLHASPQSDVDGDLDMTTSIDSHVPKHKDFRSHKLRQFFGHEVDSILPHGHEPYTSPPASSNSNRSTAPYNSPHTILSMSVSSGPSPVRRKSTSSPVQHDRPRKRSSIATIDISLATLTTCTHTQAQSPCTPKPLDNQSSHPLTRLSVVGTSPSNTPTFPGRPPSSHQHPLIPRTSPYPDLSHTRLIDARITSHPTYEGPGQGSTRHSQRQVTNVPATKSKRITKLKKMLGEPLNSNSNSNLGYAGLGVQVVREVVEEVEIEGPSLSNSNATIGGISQLIAPHGSGSSSIIPNHSHKTHSRASSASQPAPFHISRERLPHPTTSNFHLPSSRPSFEAKPSSSSRPSTAQSETLSSHRGPSFVPRLHGKGRLGKLQKFLDDVTHHGHHQKHGRKFPADSKNLPTRTITRTRKDETDVNRTQSKTRLISQAGIRNQRETKIKKQTSFFKFSSSSPPSLSSASSSLTGGGHIQFNSSTTPHDQCTASSDDLITHCSDPLTRYSNSSDRGAPSLVTNPAHGFPLTQYSHRSARKLEKLLGEQIPRQTPSLEQISDQVYWNQEIINYSPDHQKDGERELAQGHQKDREDIRDVNLSRLNYLSPTKSIEV